MKDILRQPPLPPPTHTHTEKDFEDLGKLKLPQLKDFLEESATPLKNDATSLQKSTKICII